MIIYVAHASSFDFKKELYEPLRSSELYKQYEFVLPHLQSNSPFNSKEFLRSCDLVIAEVSFPSTGMGIELGWADMIGVPVFCIYRKGSKVSSSLEMVKTSRQEYKNADDMLKIIGRYLSQYKQKLTS